MEPGAVVADAAKGRSNLTLLNLTQTPKRFQEAPDNPLGLHALVQADAPSGAAIRRGAASACVSGRVQLDGKFFKLGDEKFWIKGVTYGPFAPQEETGVPLPDRHVLESDLRLVRGLGANTLRVYHVPPRDFLDTAHAFGLKVQIGRAHV